MPNDKFRLLFKYQAFLGLRIGEVCKLQIGKIDFKKRELTIFSKKRQKPDRMIIPHESYLDTIEFIKLNISTIKISDNYIFFKGHGGHSTEVHIDANYTRKIFKQVILKAGLDSTYAYADETTRKIRPRALHRLTTHSLRHYAITRSSGSSNGNIVLTSRYSRHSNPSTTIRHVSKDQAELYRGIELAFADKL